MNISSSPRLGTNLSRFAWGCPGFCIGSLQSWESPKSQASRNGTCALPVWPYHEIFIGHCWPGRLDHIYSFNQLLLALEIWWPAKHAWFPPLQTTWKSNCVKKPIFPYCNGRKFEKKRIKRQRIKTILADFLPVFFLHISQVISDQHP